MGNQEITVKKLKQQMKKMESEQQMKQMEVLIKRDNDLQNKFNQQMEDKDAKLNEAKLQISNMQSEIIHLQQCMDEQQNKLLSQSLVQEQNEDIDESTQREIEIELERANISIMKLTKERDELVAVNKRK